jgi:surfeit locus 1 family protein
MVRFLLRPRWLAGLVLVIIVMVSFVRLGFWQLRRLDERHAYERLAASRLADPPAPVAEVLSAGPDAVAFRRVTVTGTFDPAREVVLYGRSQDGRTGNHVLTPLRLDDGSAIAVDRGWVPLEEASPPIAVAAPPPGEVRVTGVLFPSEVTSSPSDVATGTTFAKLDLPRLAAQVPYPLAPVYILESGQDPPQNDLPRIAPLPDPAESPPHLSYAIQWFSFAAIAVVGFVILVRREYRRSLRADGDYAGGGGMAGAPPPRPARPSGPAGPR